MNLAEYVKLDFSKGDKEYIRFETTGETRYLRFVYESGGDEMGKDVTFRRKYWDDEQKKYVYDTQEGQLVATLNVLNMTQTVVTLDLFFGRGRHIFVKIHCCLCGETTLELLMVYGKLLRQVLKQKTRLTLYFQ